MPQKETTPSELATFAGGCFWCTQHEFDRVPGIISTSVGYTGGSTKNPSYKEVCSGSTGHVEAIQIAFDPKKITYRQLLEVYWRSIDPTTQKGQFCDIGSQYRPIIFYHNEQQHEEATDSKRTLIESKIVNEVLVEILPASSFFPAEDYHQKYYQKSLTRYELYHAGSGRNRRLKELWGRN